MEMTMNWTHSWLGRHLTGSPKWHLFLNNAELTLTVAGQSHSVHVEDEPSYRVQQGYFWTDITIYPGQAREVRVDGLPNRRGANLILALVIEKQFRQDIAILQRSQRSMTEWIRQKITCERKAEAERRWLTHEMLMALEATRPEIDVSTFRACLNKPEMRIRLGKKAAAMDDILSIWETNLSELWIKLNADHTKRELKACKDLFDKVESKPLTVEQARAVICFDNRVLVVASAGSGKTSTMIAKAAYAINRGFVAPERIILLAFNKKAALELKERAAKSFERLGMEDVSVEASTFHALGLDIIGKVTGEKPYVPGWATSTTKGWSKLNDIVNQLKDRSLEFRIQWELFRIVFGRHLPQFGSSGSADVWDKKGNGYVVTNDGTHVRSQEEAMLADWLFYYGVEYCYEKSYKENTANQDHSQYHPDFYYPVIDLYHEHFALDAQGKPPPEFAGYLAAC